MAFGFRISNFELRFIRSWRTPCRFVDIAAVFALFALVAGCASTPPSRFYTLSAINAAGTKASSDLSVAVGPVSIPDVVDRPQIVVSVGPNQVRIEEFDRWALPLQSNIARVVAENLIALLGTSRVTLFPQATSADADYRAMIDVQRFESMPGDTAVLDVIWMVRRAKDGKTERGRTTARETIPAKDFDALAAGHSRAVARLSADLADAVRALGQ